MPQKCAIYIEAPVSDLSSRMSKVDKERELNIFREKESNHAFGKQESRIAFLLSENIQLSFFIYL